MGKLSIIPTPIGNLKDISLRAIKTLKEANIILAEDTRTTNNLLTHYGISKKKIISLFEGNEQKRTPEIINTLKKENTNIALVSESGTPLISDPGYKLIQEAIRQNINIESIPGPTALITALTLSGLPPSSFAFLGFLPRKKSKAERILKSTKNPGIKSIIIYESPFRLLETLKLIKTIFGNTKVCTARELTKLHEEVRREEVAKSIEHFKKEKPRGEFTIVVSVETSGEQAPPRY